MTHKKTVLKSLRQSYELFRKSSLHGLPLPKWDRALPVWKGRAMNTSKSLDQILATYRRRILLEDDGMADIEAATAIVEAVEGIYGDSDGLREFASTGSNQVGNPIVKKYAGRRLSTDEVAEARNEIDAAVKELEGIEYETGKDYILFKWGSLKGWELHSDKGKALSDEYLKHGRSMSAMAQKDDTRQKEIILEMIDECDGVLQSDWSGEYFTKQQAKDYMNGVSE